MNSGIKILLGGVPFGRNNVGDEAILECVVKIIRDIAPDAEITVSTDDPSGTAPRLGVETVQLFGFAPPFSRTLMAERLAAADVFIWAGATGLSDYPEIPLSMLEIAHRAGTKTVVWGVGMSDQLNPYLYRILPGKRRSLLKICSWLSGGRKDYIKQTEEQAELRARSKIAEQLNLADLVVLRDPETLTAIQTCGEVPRAIVGADSAELLKPAPWDQVVLTREARSILESDTRKVGLCISAQRKVVHQDELVVFLDRLTAENHSIIFLPMNHETDSALMNDLRDRMQNKDRSIVIGGRREPGEILAIAERLDLVISSRLHLLILAAAVHVPIIGISRGTKVDNFLAPFGHISAGSVEACDFDHIQNELDRLIDSQIEFQEISIAVHNVLLERLEMAKGRLAELLNSIR